MLAYRIAEQEDLRFVLDSFLDSFKPSHAAGLIGMDDWRRVMTEQFFRILERPTVEVWVAHNPQAENPEANIYGWLAHEQGHPLPYVIYCYVKNGYRRKGLARRLLKMAGINPAQPFEYAAKTSTLTKGGVRAAMPLAKWNPLAIRRKHPETRRNSVKDPAHPAQD